MTAGWSRSAGIIPLSAMLVAAPVANIGELATALTLHQYGAPCVVFEAVRK